MKPKTLGTDRLTLRPWRDDDAAALYLLARDPEVGPRAGWPAHVDEADSLRVIREVLSTPETYALVLRDGVEPDAPVGAISRLAAMHVPATAASAAGRLRTIRSTAYPARLTSNSTSKNQKGRIGLSAG